MRGLESDFTFSFYTKTSKVRARDNIRPNLRNVIRGTHWLMYADPRDNSLTLLNIDSRPLEVFRYFILSTNEHHKKDSENIKTISMGTLC